MPTTKVELDNGEKALGRVVYGRNVQEHFRMTHEAGIS
jgi:hypothetical protein